ncbi:MAG: glycosyltransferase [Syntrophales bacterium]
MIDEIDTPTGGTEKQLLLALERLDRQKIHPYLCVLNDSMWLRDHFDVCPVYRVGMPTLKSPMALISLFRFVSFLKKQKIGIVQTHFTRSNQIGVLAGRLAGVKTVISTRRNQGYWHTQTALFLQKRLNRWVNLFLANSNDTKEWATRTEGIPPEKIRVIHNAINLGPFEILGEEERSEYRKRFEIPSDSKVIGIVANLRSVKRIDVFLHAARIVLNEFPGVRFIVVGEGPERNALEGLSREVGLNRAVLFLGKRQDIPPILNMIDVGVLSSQSESFSNSLIEYMAAGLPIVSTDVGGCRELVSNGGNGFLVPSGNPDALAGGILNILRNPNCVTSGKVNRRIVKDKFSMGAILRSYEDLYLEVTS